MRLALNLFYWPRVFIFTALVSIWLTTLAVSTTNIVPVLRVLASLDGVCTRSAGYYQFTLSLR